MIKSLRLSGAEAGPAVAVHGLTKIFPVPFHPTRGLVAVKDLNLRIEARSSLRIAGTEWLRQEHHVKDYSRPGLTNARSHRNFWTRQSPRRESRSSFSAYELSYCEGREREAYERLQSLYDEGGRSGCLLCLSG